MSHLKINPKLPDNSTINSRQDSNSHEIQGECSQTRRHSVETSGLVARRNIYEVSESCHAIKTFSTTVVSNASKHRILSSKGSSRNLSNETYWALVAGSPLTGGADNCTYAGKKTEQLLCWWWMALVIFLPQNVNVLVSS